MKLCFYTAIKGAPLTRVMPIAFTIGGIVLPTIG